MPSILTVANLNFRYGQSLILSEVSFDLESGDYLALAGPNGAGKTTLVKLILGLEKKDSGTIELLGQPLDKFTAWDKIGYLPQKTNTFNPLFPATVQEVVSLGLLAKKNIPKYLMRLTTKKFPPL
jgi:zinc transport system ATP-binding protein